MNFRELINNIREIEQSNAEERVNLAINALKDNKVQISIDILADILNAIDGIKRCLKFITWTIENHFIIQSTINHNSINELLKKCNLDKNTSISSEISSKLKDYKLLSRKPTPKLTNSKKITSQQISETNVNPLTRRIICAEQQPRIKNTPLNPPKDKRYPTPERPLQEIKLSEIIHPTIYSYDELTKKINEYPKNIDDLLHSNYEKHLSKDEFEKVFKMSMSEFYNLPFWRQQIIKKELQLF
jgi:hypothetical protein